MRKVALWLISCLIGTAVLLTIAVAQPQTEVKPEVIKTDDVAALPASLDNFFPPRANQPVYLFKMLGMNESFTGVTVDLFENDIENARTNFKEFRTQYLEISKLIPEWEDYFSIIPLNDLEKALEKGDQEKVLTAIQQLGEVCSKCHASNASRVQHKYFWGDFQAIRINDPLTHQEVSNRQLMRYIDASFTGIELDVKQGQMENAQRQCQDFRTRFEAMEKTCMNCHDTERHYYVDESVKTMIDKLDQVLSTTPVDREMVAKLSQGIGMESCFKCHLVHMPAAGEQRQMAPYGLLKN